MDYCRSDPQKAEKGLLVKVKGSEWRAMYAALYRSVDKYCHLVDVRTVSFHPYLQIASALKKWSPLIPNKTEKAPLGARSAHFECFLHGNPLEGGLMKPSPFV